MVMADTSEEREEVRAGDVNASASGVARETTGGRGDGSPLAGLSEERRALLALELALRKARELRPRPLPREGAEPRFPLSYAQERLWFLEQVDPASGKLDRTALPGPAVNRAELSADYRLRRARRAPARETPRLAAPIARTARRRRETGPASLTERGARS